jgi:hypothetical protein
MIDLPTVAIRIWVATHRTPIWTMDWTMVVRIVVPIIARAWPQDIVPRIKPVIPFEMDEIAELNTSAKVAAIC